MRRALPALLLAACGGQAPCERDCPDLSGTYALENILVTGSCPFEAYRFGPSLNLQQSSDRRAFTANVIDPLYKLEVVMVGDIFGPAGDSLGSFSGQAQVGRDAATVEVRISGTVRDAGGRKRLNGRISTLGIEGTGAGCRVETTATGDGPVL